MVASLHGPLEIREVTPATWKDLERLFEAPGGPKYCWCMAWRASPEEKKFTENAQRKAALKRRVDEGIPVGLLGFLEGEPVAWCSVAPRPTYRRLVAGADGSSAVWSVACFFIARAHRGKGLTQELLAGAVACARQHGASVVEAYPVDEDSPSYRFMGFVPVFQDAGFVQIGREGTRRHVMQKKLAR